MKTHLLEITAIGIPNDPGSEAIEITTHTSKVKWKLSKVHPSQGHVAFNISFVAVVVRARLANMDQTLEEAASDLYANNWKTFWRVTLPMMMPGILGGALLAFTLSLDDFVITFFTSGAGFNTLPVRVYGMIKKGVTPKINAVSTLMLAFSLLLIIISLVARKGGDESPVELNI